jgi:ATP-dependent DNA helicase RecG
MRESQNVEFKQSFNEDVIETLVAFANTKGGTVIVGVDDSGKPLKGFTVGKESVQNWVNEIKTKTQPSIIPDADVIEIDGREVIEFRIQEYPVKPVATRGKYFKRVKNANHLLSAPDIADAYMLSMQYSWDAYHANNCTYADLDETKIQRFIDKVNSVGRFSLAGTPHDCLEKLRYIEGDKITHAAVLLFAKYGMHSYTAII